MDGSSFGYDIRHLVTFLFFCALQVPFMYVCIMYVCMVMVIGKSDD